MKMTLKEFYEILNADKSRVVRFAICDYPQIFLPIVDTCTAIVKPNEKEIQELQNTELLVKPLGNNFVSYLISDKDLSVLTKNKIVTEDTNTRELLDLIEKLIKEYSESEIISITVRPECEFKEGTKLSLEVANKSIYVNDYIHTTDNSDNGLTNLF